MASTTWADTQSLELMMQLRHEYTGSRRILPRSKFLFEGRVLSIDILEKVHPAVLNDYGTRVRRHHLNRAFDLYGNRLRPQDRCNDPIP